MKNILYLNTNRQATWLELFFDLVFVALIGVITHDMADTHDGRISFEQILKFLFVFVPLWWIWATHTVFANRFDTDSPRHKLFTLFIMGMIIVLSIFVKDSLRESFTYFVATYIAIRTLLACAYYVVYKKNSAQVTFSKKVARAILLGAAISSFSIFFESNIKFVFFYGGIVFDMVYQAILFHRARNFPIHRKHLVERIGLLIVIVLGETVISIVASLSKITWDFYDVMAAGFGFVLLGFIWWIYFGSLYILEEAKKLKTGVILVYSNLIFCVGLILLAALVKYSIVGGLEQQIFARLSIASLTLFYIGKQIPYMFVVPQHLKVIVINSLICISLTFVSTLLPRIEYSLVGMTLGMFVYVCINLKFTSGGRFGKNKSMRYFVNNDD